MDGQLLASGSFDGLVKIWDASSGDLKCTLEGPGGGIEVHSLSIFSSATLIWSYKSWVQTMSLCSGSGGIQEDMWSWLVQRIAQFGCGMLTEVPTLTCFQVMLVVWPVAILLLMVLYFLLLGEIQCFLFLFPLFFFSNFIFNFCFYCLFKVKQSVLVLMMQH